LAEDVAGLKKRHSDHVRRHVDGFTKHAVLKQKLLQREPLQTTEATGDCFSQLLSEVQNLRVMTSPYRLTLQQFEKQIASVRERFRTIITEIEGAWKVPELTELIYRFSDTSKGANIVLSEGSLRVNYRGTATYSQLAIV
jgi:hypothetical protein